MRIETNRGRLFLFLRRREIRRITRRKRKKKEKEKEEVEEENVAKEGRK